MATQTITGAATALPAPAARGASRVPRAPESDAVAAGLSDVSARVSAARPRTAAGERALRRRRARTAADRRPPSGLLPSGHGTAASVSADRGDEVCLRRFRPGRWTRLGTTVALLAACLIVGVARSAPDKPEVVGQVTVASGDTLWSIAVRAEPAADPRAVVQRIKQLNALGGDLISPGAVLRVPMQAP